MADQPDNTNHAIKTSNGCEPDAADIRPLPKKSIEPKTPNDRARTASIAMMLLAISIWLFTGIWVIQYSMTDFTAFISNGYFGWSAPLGQHHWPGKGLRLYPCAHESRNLLKIAKVTEEDNFGWATHYVRIPLWILFLVIALIAMLSWRGAKRADFERLWPLWRGLGGAAVALAMYFLGRAARNSYAFPAWFELSFFSLLFVGLAALTSLPLRNYRTALTVCAGATLTVAYISVFSMPLGSDPLRSFRAAAHALLGSIALCGLGCGLPVALAVYLNNRYWPVCRPGHCRKCDYNLTGLTSPRCPECGTEFDLSDAAAPRRNA